MDKKPANNSPAPDSPLAETVGVKEARKLRAKRHAGREVWRGLGMMGMIGWSVALPTLLGALVGRWLDKANPVGRSWTLALLVAGLMIGCVNAWHWVARENRSNRDVGEDEK